MRIFGRVWDVSKRLVSEVSDLEHNEKGILDAGIIVAVEL